MGDTKINHFLQITEIPELSKFTICQTLGFLSPTEHHFIAELFHSMETIGIGLNFTYFSLVNEL